MPRSHASRASSRAVCGVAALLLLSGAAPSPPADPAAHYALCLDRARRTPPAGLKDAQDWRAAGGGFPAEHCAAVALFGLQRYREAAQAFADLGGAMMGEPAALRAGAMEQAGEAWLLAADPLQARAAFDAALRYAPDEPTFRIDRARADADLGDYEQAVTDLDAALSRQPGNAQALIYRASAYRELGDLDRARADIDQALKAVPDDAPALLERGNIRRLEGDAAGARADWQRVVKLLPGSPAALAARDNLANLAAK